MGVFISILSPRYDSGGENNLYNIKHFGGKFIDYK